MSTIAEIREAISQLSEADRALLLDELFATHYGPDENDPELLAKLDRGLADDEADRVHSIQEVDSMVPQWITKSS